MFLQQTSFTKIMSAIASIVLQRLTSLLVDKVTEELKQILGSREEAASFTDKLQRLQQGLQNAEEKQVTDSDCKNWLQDLKDVMDDMYDTLDDWEIYHARKTAVQRSFSWKKVLFLIQCPYFRRISRKREIIGEMKNFSKKIDVFLDQRGGRYNLVPTSSSETKPFMPPETTSKVDAKRVFGRDSDMESLVSTLLHKGEASTSTGSVLTSTSTNSFHVISLVGVGGIGKTTLAQLAYNDHRLNGHFKLKLWVSVSNPFDALKVVKGVLESANQMANDISTLEALTTRVQTLVWENKFLLVLDNILQVDSTEWETLMNCLHGAPGSRILVTTRDPKVARMISDQWITLGPLLDTFCKQIVNERALRGRTVSEKDKLIGEDVAIKCGGSPLAARVLGDMLACRKTEDWSCVLENPMFKEKYDAYDLRDIVNMGYIDLSPTLKRCFSSCAIFKKGDKVNRGELIRIWLSKGYLRLADGAKQIQLEGEKCFNNLAMRSFFQDVWDEKDDTFCKIHDVMHDFAIHLSKNENCLIMDVRFGEENKLDDSSHSKMRTVVIRDVPISQQQLFQLVTSLKRARLLILRSCKLEEIPDELGELVHLRYLDLSYNDIKELPKSLCDLYHLQTLCLEYCYFLSMLPEGIHKLVNLRHILVQDSTQIKFPRGLENLTRLWTLRGFRVGRGHNKLGYLQNLNQLHGTLRIAMYDMNEVADVEEAKEADLGKKDKIEELELDIEGEVRTGVVEALQPPCNLKRLVIDGGKIELVSSWMRRSYLENIKSLELIGLFGWCKSPPSLGRLPSLETLMLVNIPFRSLGVELLGINFASSHLGNCVIGVCGFPNLKELIFFLCKQWEEWKDIGENELDCLTPIYPRLQELTVQLCPRLEVLPHNLIRKVSSLESLTIINSEDLCKAYCERGVHRDKISQIPHITII